MLGCCSLAKMLGSIGLISDVKWCSAPADQRDRAVVAVDVAVLAPVYGAVALVQARVAEAGQPRVVPRVLLRQPPPLRRTSRSATRSGLEQEMTDNGWPC